MGVAHVGVGSLGQRRAHKHHLLRGLVVSRLEGAGRAYKISLLCIMSAQRFCLYGVHACMHVCERACVHV